MDENQPCFNSYSASTKMQRMRDYLHRHERHPNIENYYVTIFQCELLTNNVSPNTWKNIFLGMQQTVSQLIWFPL